MAESDTAAHAGAGTDSACPDFLHLPFRMQKPRTAGITHVLDKGLSPTETGDLVGQAGQLIDIVKIGWGIGYVDRTLPARVAAYRSGGIGVCLGGTLTEIVALQGRVTEMRDWALRIGITHAEVSNGLRQLSDADNHLVFSYEQIRGLKRSIGWRPARVMEMMDGEWLSFRSSGFLQPARPNTAPAIPVGDEVD